jgi:hypothetical protein
LRAEFKRSQLETTRLEKKTKREKEKKKKKKKYIYKKEKR